MISESASEQSTMSSPPTITSAAATNSIMTNESNNTTKPLKNKNHKSATKNHEHRHNHHKKILDKAENAHKNDDLNDNDPRSAASEHANIIIKKKKKKSSSGSSSTIKSKSNETKTRLNQLGAASGHADNHQDHQQATKVKSTKDSSKHKPPNDKPTSTNAPKNNDNICSTSNAPIKKIKKEKKRFQEFIIDGFTITAFKTWEDLQDELNERISADVKRNTTQDDIEIPNTSCSSAHSSLTTSETSILSDHTTTATSLLLQPKQASTSLSNSSSSASSSSGNISQHLQEKRKDLSNVQPIAHINRNQIDTDRQHSIRAHNNIRPNSETDETARQRNHDKSSQSREDHHHHHHRHHHEHKVKKQVVRDAPVPPNETSHQRTGGDFTNQNKFINSVPPVYNPYNYGAERQQEQLYQRQSHPGDVDLKRQHTNMNKPTTYDSSRTATASIGSSANPNINYPMHTPKQPSHPPHTAQHYLQQQYHQLYQQMHTAQHPQLPHHQPMHPYMAFMNHHHQQSSLTHPSLQAPPPLQLPPPPQPPAPPSLSMPPGPSSMMSQSPYISPYTITDTIISRQTSIIPPSFGHLQQHSSTSYMPSPTERSFMEFARSYANASNMSSSYSNVPSLYGSGLERNMAMEHHHHRTTMSGGGLSGNPFAPFGGPGAGGARPPINPITMYPPHFYP